MFQHARRRAARVASSACLVMAMGIGAAMADADMTGRQIMDEVAERHDKPYEFEEQNMVLTDSSGAEEARTLKRYVREADDLFKYLLVFHEPAGVEGVALLTWQNDSGEDDQFLYLPSMGKKIKRIAKGGKRNYFMGTDFTFEDLVSESRDKFEYARLEDGSYDGQAAFVIDVTPVDEAVKKSTGYKSRRITVLKDSFFVAQTEYYDRRGRFIKKQTALKYGPVDGEDGLWRASETLMENEKENHSTRVTIASRSFDEDDVPARSFKQRHITSGRHVR